MSLYTRLEYFRFTSSELAVIIDKDIEGSSIKLYCYLRLNCDLQRGISSAVNYKDISIALDMHRTTVMRALAELEEAKLIIPRETGSGETYNLPFSVDSNRISNRAAAEKRKKNAERKYAAEKENIEIVLSRRLTHPEIRRLKDKHGL